MGKHDSLSGRKLRRERAPRELRIGRYVIMTDGEKTEKNYFEGLRNSLPPEDQKEFQLKVIHCRTSRLVSRCEELDEPANFSEKWIVFDRDRVPDFDELIKQAEARGFHVAWSNPCIEIWFWAYFGKMGGVTESKDCWKRFASVYQKKTGQEYEKADAGLYRKLVSFGDEAAAIRRARQTYEGLLQADAGKPRSDMCPCTTVYQLVGEVRERLELAKGEER